jgi:hypothetical protein
MELVRKSATGNLAEVVGRDFLSDDIEARRQFYSQEELDALRPASRARSQTLVQGFVDGVNAVSQTIYADTTLAVRAARVLLPAHRPSGSRATATIPTGVRYTVETIGGARSTTRRWRTTDVGGDRPYCWPDASVAAAAASSARRHSSTTSRRQARRTPDVARQVVRGRALVNDPNAPTTVPKEAPSTREGRQDAVRSPTRA